MNTCIAHVSHTCEHQERDSGGRQENGSDDANAQRLVEVGESSLCNLLLLDGPPRDLSCQVRVGQDERHDRRASLQSGRVVRICLHRKIDQRRRAPPHAHAATALPRRVRAVSAGGGSLTEVGKRARAMQVRLLLRLCLVGAVVRVRSLCCCFFLSHVDLNIAHRLCAHCRCRVEGSNVQCLVSTARVEWLSWRQRRSRLVLLLRQHTPSLRRSRRKLALASLRLRC